MIFKKISLVLMTNILFVGLFFGPAGHAQAASSRAAEEQMRLNLGITYADPVECFVTSQQGPVPAGFISFENLCQEAKDFLEPFADNQMRWEGWKGGREANKDKPNGGGVPNRCNNPGNINANPTYLALVEKKFGTGSYKLDQPECFSGPNHHVWFASPEAGIYYYQNFIINRLGTPDGSYANAKTIGEFLDTYCPPSDNCDPGYVDNVIKDAKIKGVQTTRNTTMAEISEAIKCGQAAPVPAPPQSDETQSPQTNSFNSTNSSLLDKLKKLGTVEAQSASFNGEEFTASVYGTQGEKDSAGKYIEYLGGIEGGPVDERGTALAGSWSVAELKGNSSLGRLPYGTKLKIEYKGKSVVVAVNDNGPAPGADIDLWREVADALSFPYGKDKVKVYSVPEGTALGPSDGQAASASSGGGGGGCLDSSGVGGSTGTVNTEGYSFPMGGVTKANYGNSAMSALPCKNTAGCHHKGPASCCDPAFDLGIKTSGNGSETEGLPVYAIHDGTLLSVKDGYNSTPGCVSIMLKQAGSKNPADDGWQYWYGHIRKPLVASGATVKAGQQIAEVGQSKCAKDTWPHLHIDRGVNKTSGGGTGRRDPAFIPLLNSLFEGLS